ncbi:MAG: hypothetical protein BEN19_05755 [Epulopiscium sp. Nuni2H_MBin003]|nr:MAG: hypothetical protein BEN19_05755 [Epulopiscium sp. Nuni2H_MBin003]
MTIDTSNNYVGEYTRVSQNSDTTQIGTQPPPPPKTSTEHSTENSPPPPPPKPPAQMQQDMFDAQKILEANITDNATSYTVIAEAEEVAEEVTTEVAEEVAVTTENVDWQSNVEESLNRMQELSETASTALTAGYKQIIQREIEELKEDIIEYIDYYNNELGKPITNLKLQKLLYYVQANFLLNKKDICFEEDIIHWTLGPVVKEVYEKFKIFNSKNLILFTFYIYLLFLACILVFCKFLKDYFLVLVLISKK